MTNDLIVEKTPKIAALPVSRFRWRNRFVTKDGKGHRACKAWPEQSQAAERAAYWEKRCREQGNAIDLETLDGVIAVMICIM